MLLATRMDGCVSVYTWSRMAHRMRPSVGSTTFEFVPSPSLFTVHTDAIVGSARPTFDIRASQHHIASTTRRPSAARANAARACRRLVSQFILYTLNQAAAAARWIDGGKKVGVDGFANDDGRHSVGIGLRFALIV